jgi:hypothetical protein
MRVEDDADWRERPALAIQSAEEDRQSLAATKRAKRSSSAF